MNTEHKKRRCKDSSRGKYNESWATRQTVSGRCASIWNAFEWIFDPLHFFCWSSFEKTLKQKLSQKASGASNEETVLLKAFKYFDLNNNGTVEPDEFAKACEKIGIMIPTRQVSLNIQGNSSDFQKSR